MEREVPRGREFVDTAHRILANRHRRLTFRFLEEQEGTASFDDLVDRLVALDGPEAGRPDRDRIELELHHTHLPLMVETGMVEYDPDADRITLTAQGRRIVEVRRATDECLGERRIDHG